MIVSGTPRAASSTSILSQTAPNVTYEVDLTEDGSE